MLTIIARIEIKTELNHSFSKAMVKLEKITALILAAGLAIPSYWFFWSLAGGGGYERRGSQNIPLPEKNLTK